MIKLKEFIKTDQFLLLVVIFIGTILRFWNFNSIPLTHDEFSALFRTNFNNFRDLINYGVIVDTHPAGIQVFIYYWIKLFGISEIAIKFPFIILGILSIPLIYKIGKSWFNSTSGLIAASFIAFLQFPIMYSQIARPYVSGLFFCLLMVYFWDIFLFKKKSKIDIKSLIGFTLSAELCSYNHYFSLLFAIIVSLTGLLFCNRKQIIYYLLSGVLIVILYVPHFPIFFSQFAQGGVEGWLGKPNNDYLFEFIKYIFHFSYYIFLLLVLLIGLSFVWNHFKIKNNYRFVIISIVWFLLPFLIGFFYSRYVNAVLQYSTLIFSFPFLILCYASFIDVQKRSQKVILIFLIAIITIPSLILERNYYTYFYQSPYEQFIKQAENYTNQFGKEKCSVCISSVPKISKYYYEKYQIEPKTFFIPDTVNTQRSISNWVDKTNTPYLIYGCLFSSTSETFQLILDKYPYIVEHQKYFNGDFYVFSKEKKEFSKKEYLNLFLNDFEGNAKNWDKGNVKSYVDSIKFDGKLSYQYDSLQEYGPTFSIPLSSLTNNKYNFIDISLKAFTNNDFTDAVLVAQIDSASKNIFWGGTDFSKYTFVNKWSTVVYSIKLADLNISLEGLDLKIYIWNNKKQNFQIDQIKIATRKGNSIAYGLNQAY